MTILQYSSMQAIYIYGLMFLPIILLQFFGKKCIPYNIFINFVGIVLLLGIKTTEMKQFLIFIACELMLIYFYYYFRKICSSELVYFLTIAASMLPILLVKSSIYLPVNKIGFLGISYICFKIWSFS